MGRKKQKKKPNWYQPLIDLYHPLTFDILALNGDGFTSHRLENAVCATRMNSEMDGLSNREAIENVYRWMCKNYRVEYVYTNLLCERYVYPNKGMTAVGQMKIGSRIADLVTFDGDVPIVYEIKTAYDSFSRLQDQIDMYMSVFHQMSLVIPEKKLEKARKVLGGQPVGILVLADDGTFRVERPPVVDAKVTDKRMLFGMLTPSEREYVHYMGHGNYVQELDEKVAYRKNREDFYRLSDVDAFRIVMHELRKRGKRIPEEGQLVGDGMKTFIYMSRLHSDETFRFSVYDWLDKDFHASTWWEKEYERKLAGCYGDADDAGETFTETDDFDLETVRDSD